MYNNREKDTTEEFVSNDATASVTVCYNREPPVAEDDFATVYEDETVQIPILDNDTDLEGDDLILENIEFPSIEQRMVNPDDGITYTPSQAECDRLAQEE